MTKINIILDRQKHHRVKYYNLLTSVKLVEHLNDVDLRAREMEERLIKELAEKEIGRASCRERV